MKEPKMTPPRNLRGDPLRPTARAKDDEDHKQSKVKAQVVVLRAIAKRGVFWPGDG